jgi:hypothetical protein
MILDLAIRGLKKADLKRGGYSARPTTSKRVAPPIRDFAAR